MGRGGGSVGRDYSRGSVTYMGRSGQSYTTTFRSEGGVGYARIAKTGSNRRSATRIMNRQTYNDWASTLRGSFSGRS